MVHRTLRKLFRAFCIFDQASPRWKNFQHFLFLVFQFSFLHLSLCLFHFIFFFSFFFISLSLSILSLSLSILSLSSLYPISLFLCFPLTPFNLPLPSVLSIFMCHLDDQLYFTFLYLSSQSYIFSLIVFSANWYCFCFFNFASRMFILCNFCIFFYESA